MMLLERIESEGLAHYSYVLGQGGDAVVIDPRRDVDTYLKVLERHDLRLRHVLETHRNEDYLVGSTTLATLTGADVWHADGQFQYRYGQAVQDGQSWQVGDLTLETIHTPGHTPGHMCYVVRTSDDRPWLLFSGDCLFAGEVGRTDLMGEERLDDMTGALHRSLHERVLPLGDHVVLLPAHGPGSACGGAIADRPWTTIGLERRLNPTLDLERDAFMKRQAAAQPRPPYFRRMEARNLEPRDEPEAWPPPLPPQEAAELAAAFVLDTRMPPAFLAAHIPGALSIWAGGLGSWAGWFVPADRPLVLVTEQAEREAVLRTLARMGFDDVRGVLQGGMHAWHVEGLESEGLGAVSVPEAQRRLRAGRPHLLDVRTPVEHEEGVPPGAQLLPLDELGERLGEVPSEDALFVFCGSGLRSTVAASILAREGRRDVHVILGGMKGWEAKGGAQTDVV